MHIHCMTSSSTADLCLLPCQALLHESCSAAEASPASCPQPRWETAAVTAGVQQALLSLRDMPCVDDSVHAVAYGLIRT